MIKLARPTFVVPNEETTRKLGAKSTLFRSIHRTLGAQGVQSLPPTKCTTTLHGALKVCPRVSWCTLETSGNVLQALHQTPKAIQNTSFVDPAPPEERPHAHWQLRRRSFKTSSPLTLKDTLFIARSPTKATFDGQVAAQHGRSGMREAITIS